MKKIAWFIAPYITVLIIAVIAYWFGLFNYLVYEPVESEVSEWIEAEKPILPPGYRVVCSLDGNKYALIDPGKSKVGFNVWDSEQKAIKFAIHWEKVKDVKMVRPSSKYIWVDCKEGG